jgi:hypothetical protein
LDSFGVGLSGSTGKIVDSPRCQVACSAGEKRLFREKSFSGEAGMKSSGVTLFLGDQAEGSTSGDEGYRTLPGFAGPQGAMAD